MPNPEGKPIFFVKEGRSEKDRAHVLYARLSFLKKDYRLLKGLPSSPLVADIGCGDGTFLRRAKLIRPDARLAGVDAGDYLEFESPDQLDSFSLADLERQDIPLASESVDYLHCSHVVEHLHEPVRLFREIRRVLKKGGLAYLEAPAPITLFLPSLGTIGTVNFHDDCTHVRPYTKESFRRLGLQAGFTEEEIRVFCPRNGFNLLFLPYTFLRFLMTGRNYYAQSFLQPLLGTDTGGIFRKGYPVRDPGKERR